MVSVYCIRQNGSPFWYAQWVVPATGRRKTRSLKTKDPGRAEHLRAELEARLNRPGADPEELRWPEFVERFVAERLGEGSAGGAQNARRHLGRFARAEKPAGPGWVTAEMLSRHAARLRQEGLAPTTVGLHLANLKTALRWAAEVGVIERPPRFPKVKAPRTRMKPHLKPERFGELLARAPSPAWRLFTLACWHTGMRVGELFLLRWDQGDGPWLDLGRARVRFPADYVKGRTDDWLPIHRELLAELLASAARKEGGSGRVFDLAPSAKLLSERFCRWAKGLCKTHDLRRSFGTRYAPLVPSHVLQRLMRHARIQTTLEYYADLDDALEGAINLL